MPNEPGVRTALGPVSGWGSGAAPAVPNDSVEIAVYSPITGRTHEGPSVEVPLLGFWLACRHRTPRMPPFAVRARCHAAAHFDWGDVWRLNYPEGRRPATQARRAADVSPIVATDRSPSRYARP